MFTAFTAIVGRGVEAPCVDLTLSERSRWNRPDTGESRFCEGSRTVTSIGTEQTRGWPGGEQEMTTNRSRGPLGGVDMF